MTVPTTRIHHQHETKNPSSSSSLTRMMSALVLLQLVWPVQTFTIPSPAPLRLMIPHQKVTTTTSSPPLSSSFCCKSTKSNPLMFTTTLHSSSNSNNNNNNEDDFETSELFKLVSPTRGDDEDEDKDEKKENDFYDNQLDYGVYQYNDEATDQTTTNPQPVVSNPNTQDSDTATKSATADAVALQIQQQQQQIDMLIEMVKNQNQQQQQQGTNADKMSDNPTQKAQDDDDTNRINNYNKSNRGDTSSSSTTTTTSSSPSSLSESTLPPPLPGMFDDIGEEELMDHQEIHNNDNINGLPYSQSTTTTPLTPQQQQRQQRQQQQQQPSTPTTTTNIIQPLAPLKAMLFIDGTWLYYSLHRRREQDDPIVKKFGRGWQYRYRFDWAALPRIVCEQMAGQMGTMGWTSTGSTTTNRDSSSSSTTTPSSMPIPPIPIPQPATVVVPQQRPMEIVRASVFTSYKKTTDPNSFRVKMYNEMADANYDIHMLESFGNGPEKCVDISLAVEMLHYATVPNAYDVAILLSGDKDFIPALVRTRQKGRKVGIVSMRTGCNRSLQDSPHVKDYDIVWIDNFLDDLLVPLPPEQVGKRVESIYDRGLLSAFTITKIMLDFIKKSPLGNRVSSRDVGRYLKGVQMRDGTNLLDDLKLGQGGLRRFLQERMGLVFLVTDRKPEEIYQNDPRDKSYWISVKKGAAEILIQEAKITNFSEEEKQFLEDYELGKVGNDDHDNYYHTNGGSDFPGFDSSTKSSPTPSNSGDSTKAIHLELPPDLTEDYTTYTVARLKERCRERGLPVTGAKAILLERVQNDVEEEVARLKIEIASQQQISQPPPPPPLPRTKKVYSNIDIQVTMYLEKLIKYFITQNNGLVSSRELGRFLASNDASSPKTNGMRRISALQELKKSFGSVSSFLDYRSSEFAIVQGQVDGDESEFAFGIELTDKVRTESSSSQHPSPGKNTNTNGDDNMNSNDVTDYLHDLLVEYIKASGGEASSRNIGRYLAANKPSRAGRNRTALQELKEHFGSLANFIISRNDIFFIVRDSQKYNHDGSQTNYDFGVRLN